MNRMHVFLAATIGTLALGCRDLPADDPTTGGDVRARNHDLVTGRLGR